MKEFKNFKAQSLQPDKTAESDANGLQENLQKYSEMDREQLMQQLLTNISTQKANGTYDKERIDQFLNFASSVLPPDQVQRMRQLLDSIDEKDGESL